MITKVLLANIIVILAIQGSDAKIKWHQFWGKTIVEDDGKCTKGNPPGPKDSDITGDYGGIIPTYYKIALQLPILDKTVNGTGKATDGRMTLFFKTKRKTEFVYLMTKDTEIDLKGILLYFVNPLTSKSTNIKLTYKCLDTQRNSLILQPLKPLVPQAVDDTSYYTLIIKKFKGKIRPPTANGVFATEETADSPIATQFQADNARFAFPCIDIPQFKTGFEVKLTHPPGTIALSNMELKKSGKDSKGWLWDVFLTTPPLSTYLVAFTIQPEDRVNQVESRTTRNIDLKVFSNNKDTTMSKTLLYIAVFCLNDLWMQLQTPLQLRKIDFVQISGFPFGGMENFGMITLKYDLGDETALVHVQAHELAHHWVSDTVTVRNWKHLAVQEGLTDYLSYRTTDHFYKYHKQPDTADLVYIMNVISAMTTAPSTSLELPYDLPVITHEAQTKLYGKATFIQGMLEKMIGEEEFLKRVREFIREHSYRDFTIDDYLGFFHDIKLDAGKGTVSASDVYLFWFMHGKYPALKLERNFKTETANITEMSAKENEPNWLVPLKIITPKGNIGKDFYPAVLNGSTTVNLKGVVSKDEPLILNPEAEYMYPMTYDFDSYDLLLNQIANKPDSLSFRARVWQLVGFCSFIEVDKSLEKLWKKYGEKILKQEKTIPQLWLGKCIKGGTKQKIVNKSYQRWKLF